MILRPALWVGACTVLAGGCSLFVGVPDGLTGGDAGSDATLPTDGATDGVIGERGSTDRDGDAAATDDSAATGDGGPISCADSGKIICEDFEHGINAPYWTTQGDEGSIGLDQVHVHRGAYALHASLATFQADAPDVYGPTIQHIIAPHTGTIYSRIYVYVPYPVSPNAPEGFMSFNNTSGGGTALAVTPQNVDAVPALSISDWADNPNVNVMSATEYPAEIWSCVEWRFGDGTMSVSQDGVELTDLAQSHLPGTANAGFTSFTVGMRMYTGGATATDLWLDDLIVDTSPISCAE